LPSGGCFGSEDAKGRPGDADRADLNRCILTPWLKEGGKGTVPIAFHFQLRPNPLAD
jgi:hypothetical protein